MSAVRLHEGFRRARASLLTNAWKGALLGLFLFLGSASSAFAGFGITPPYVKNDALARESVYVQKIILTRSDPVEDLRADVTINVPGANSWIKIDKTNSFILPKGASQVPMEVMVTIPGNAKYGQYVGNIRVVISPDGPPTPGTVGISLGAQIDVDLTVIDKEIYEFDIRGVSIEDAEEGHYFWKFFFPGKIRFSMLTQNLGNVPFGPTKVVFVIRNNAGEIMETTRNSNKLQKIRPFDIRNVVAELPTRLPPGGYKAQFSVYKNAEVVRAGEVSLSILPYGTLPGYNGYGFGGLKAGEQALIILMIVGAIAVLGALIFFLVRLIRRRRRRKGY